MFFVSWPLIPEIEFININKDAVVTMCLGLPAFIKKRIGLKKIPPPIPITPEIKPRTAPIEIEIILGISKKMESCWLSFLFYKNIKF